MSQGLAGRSFDYVIIGGGPAGCVLAARLSERSDLSVLLLEAGGPYQRILSIPLVGMRKIHTLSWKYQTSPQSHLGSRRLALPFGKLIGGSSSINAMMYVRGTPAAYDRWAELGNPGWGFSDLLPYFRKSERFEDGASAYHGDRGPIYVSHPRFRAPFSSAFVAACLEIGIPGTDDFNGSAPEGAGFYDVMQNRGVRSAAAKAYLGPAKHRANLRIMPHANVQRILINHGCATGVEFLDAHGQTQRVSADREVILSAGSLNSPKLLMLSGIGPADPLQALGIPCMLDLPGVGANLQDHPRVPVLYETSQRSPGAKLHWPGAVARYAFNRTGVLASNCCESGALVRSHAGVPIPDLQFVTHFQSHQYPGVVDLQFNLAHVHSRGRVSLTSADPQTAPKIDPNFLSDPADVLAAIAGIRLARKIAATSRLQAFPLTREILPGADLQSDAQLHAYCQSMAETSYHTIGTCRMGTDAMAVVDPNLRVHGLNQLRVVDASVMPELPNGNTCAPTYMIAEKAADLILAHT